MNLAAPRTRYVIFLFDDRHLTSADLTLVQKAATHLLETPLPETDDAAVLSFNGVNSGLTHDHAALQSAVMKLTVHQALQHGKEDCPDVDYYSADQIINKHDPIEFQIAVQKARQCSLSQVVIVPSPNIYDGLDNPLTHFNAQRWPPRNMPLRSVKRMPANHSFPCAMSYAQCRSCPGNAF